MPSRVAPKSVTEEAAPPQGERLLLKRAVCARTGRSYPTIWLWMREGKFPRARDLNGRPAWLKSEIDSWIDNLRVKTFKGEHQPGKEPHRPTRPPKNKARAEERAR